jgi:hypothetical protein
MTRREVLEASGPIRVLLVELSFRGAFLVHRRLLEDQAFNNLTLVLEDLLDEAGVRRPHSRSSFRVTSDRGAAGS